MKKKANRSARLRPVLGLRVPRLLLAILLIPAFVYIIRSETLTLSTTYPSPMGVYRSLITTGGSASSPANTILSRDAGNVGIGTQSPGAKLDVRGAINVSGNVVAQGTGTAADWCLTGGTVCLSNVWRSGNCSVQLGGWACTSNGMSNCYMNCPTWCRQQVTLTCNGATVASWWAVPGP